MKKYAKSAADAADCSVAAEKIEKAERTQYGGIRGIFYASPAEFEELRAEIERPAKVDEGLRKLLKNRHWVKWNSK